jgi:hypothetical protein
VRDDGQLGREAFESRFLPEGAELEKRKNEEQVLVDLNPADPLNSNSEWTQLGGPHCRT